MSHNPDDVLLEHDRHVIARRKEHLMTEITAQPSSSVVPQHASGRSSGRRRRLAIGMAAVVALTAGTFAATSFSGGPAGKGATAFAVEKLPSGSISIKVVGTAASAQQMTDQLRAQGVNVTIDTEPVSSQLVGTWITFATPDGVATPLTHLLMQQFAGATATLEIPASLLATTRLKLTVGRAPHDGEALEATGERNVFSPGGLLYCYELAGGTAAVAQAALSSAGYHLHWKYTGGPVSASGPGGWSSTPSTGVVTRAFIGLPGTSGGDHDVYIQTANPGDPQFKALLWSGYGPSAEASNTRDYSGCPAR